MSGLDGLGHPGEPTLDDAIELAAHFIGSDYRNWGVVQAAFSHAENLRTDLAAERKRCAELSSVVKRLVKKCAADGCPRESVAGCVVTLEYGGAQCVKCWLKSVGVDVSTLAPIDLGMESEAQS
jgi:hypothetical protein